jgi:hypothetical protein
VDEEFIDPVAADETCNRDGSERDHSGAVDDLQAAMP